MNPNPHTIPVRSAPSRTARAALAAIALISYLIPHLSSLHAAVPLKWTVETSRVQPAVFDVVRGETIELEAAFNSYGTPVETTNQTAFLAWQTNGMENAWWITNATTRTVRAPADRPNLATALFTPDMDPGAPTVTGFIGLSDATNTSSLIPHPSSLNYRAAFTLRFRKGPGATPNAIEQPPPILDLARTVVVNPPWPTQADFAATTTVMKAELKTYVDGQIEGAGLVTPQSVTNAAGTVASNVVTKAYVESLGIESGLDTNAVATVITNHVTAGYLAPASALTSLASLESLASATQDTLNAAKAMTNAIPRNRITDGTNTVMANRTFTRIKRGHGIGSWTVNGILCDQYIKESLPGIDEWYGVSPLSGSTMVWLETDDTRVTIEGHTSNGSSFAATFDPFPGFDHTYMIDAFDIYGGTNITIIAKYNPEIESAIIATTNDIPNAYTRTQSDARYAPTSTAVTVASHASQLSQLSQSVSAKADAATVDQLNVQVQALGANANAEDARVVVTNYNSATRMPEAQFDVKVSNSWITVWHEMTRWNGFLGGFAAYTNGVASALANKGEKEWGWFDSATGNPSPDGILQLSQTRIQVCSGAAYQRYVSTTGSVWVLESNGLVADINGTTNGYFRITDEEGNAHFEIVKGDKQSLFATSKTMTQQQIGVTHYFTTYAVTNAVTTPVAQFSRSLSNPVWIKESEAGCPCNVSWTNNGDNSWTVEWWPIGNEPVLFMMAGYEKGGETYIRNVVPVKMQHIYLGNTKYLLGTATIDGHTVLTLTAQ